LHRDVLAAAFLALVSVAPSAGAQELGLWQSRVGEGVAYGEPRAGEALVATDPVAAIAPSPAVRATAPAAPAGAAPAPAIAKAIEAPAPVVAVPVVIDRMNTYNPDLPLPHPDLQGFGPAKRVSTSPRPYLKGDDHGAVFGVTVPLGANRVPIATKATRSGGGPGPAEGGFGNR
jgi:hypothetical protein